MVCLPWRTAGRLVFGGVGSVGGLGTLVFGGRLWDAHGVGSVGGLGSLVFACAPGGAVALGESGYEVPVDAVMLGRAVTGVACNHLGQREEEWSKLEVMMSLFTGGFTQGT